MSTRESLTDKAYAQLEEMIVTLQLAPGAVLSEMELGERLNIGRTPVREALHRLAREGLVLILPRKGILVTEMLDKAVTEHPPPLVRGRRIKLRYAHFGGQNPPTIVIHGNQT